MISWVRRWGREAIRWAGDGAELLFPPRCCRCQGEDGVAGNGLCNACARVLAADRARCSRCGTVARGTDGCCSTCRRDRPSWDGLTLLGGYDAELREAILRLKRPGAENLAAALGTLLVAERRSAFDVAACDAVVPVPMHWWRRARRGTSAAEDIGSAIGRALGLPVVSALVRVRATPMQNELPAAERPANVAGAFRARRPVKGRRLLVVDDVVTTGATLAACCRELRAAGAAAVYGAALARADRSGDPSDREAEQAWSDEGIPA